MSFAIILSSVKVARTILGPECCVAAIQVRGSVRRCPFARCRDDPRGPQSFRRRGRSGGDSPASP